MDRRAAVVSRLELARSVYRTWRPAGLARRARYEIERRAGRHAAAERRWLAELDRDRLSLRLLDLSGPVDASPAPTGSPEGITLYGGLPVDTTVPPAWTVHPLTGHRYDPAAHWSTFSDADPTTGDIKDVWELARLSWLLPIVRRWRIDGDATAGETAWLVLDDWVSENPAYVGVGWMCGQESSLRATTAMLAASALATSPATTAERNHRVAVLVGETVGRVLPTLSYALSQRNNHAISEAAFLWTASLLLDGLPDATAIRRRAATVLDVALRDQLETDGAYAQHSPTYQRLALHNLLWLLAVARHTGEPPPVGVTSAVTASTELLLRMLDVGTGRVPNLGNNDGSLLLDLSPCPIHDFRPVLVHAAAATDRPTPIPPGPWDDEATWLGLRPRRDGAAPPGSDPAGVAHHIHRGRRSHAVLRAGPLRHRPANADQLHVDVWIDGTAVASDPGSFRYTATAPWANPFVTERAHNLPSVPGAPQAELRTRFLWDHWTEARIIGRVREPDHDVTDAELVLPGGAVLRRRVERRGDVHRITDRSSDPEAEVRWNLPPTAVVTHDRSGTGTSATGDGWQAAFTHGPGARVLDRRDDDPLSGWASPTYGVRVPVLALVLPVGPSGEATAEFIPGVR